ncbi:hypothetical protein MARBORIA2_00730 [Methanobrevibacter arboriphilus]|uniref:Uncharacterized protein n=1 Tax=Methanobrevibacter arboriphilus TaxID=39441 RepID=A0ACA8R2P6_METAZ|nr:hypothetical protein MarbSA_09110 [Methanobrevibacter arboriphilus]GLI10983.1 hypothetical protein MARBORIA2_00730 [Methanobrevibacter arboriphilus]
MAIKGEISVNIFGFIFILLAKGSRIFFNSGLNLSNIAIIYENKYLYKFLYMNTHISDSFIMNIFYNEYFFIINVF